MKKSHTQLITEFVEGLNEAIGAAGGMIHYHQDLRWDFVRKILEETKDKCIRFSVNPMTAPQITRAEKKSQILLP